MAHLEKKTGEFIEALAALKAPPIYKLKVPEARKVLDDVQKGGKKLPVHVEKIALPGTQVSLQVVRPQTKEVLPVILYCHGGGWILGNYGTHERLVSELAIGAHAAVVFVNYTPSPEAKYPQALNEAFDALKYVLADGASLQLDPSRLAVVGDSVGGNMAAAITLLAKEHGLKLLCQVLLYPVTDADFNNGSYREFAEGPWLTKAAMEWFWNAYQPNVSERKKATVCPLHASLDQLKHLPRALVITDENDVLRDEGEAYAHKLMEAGVEVTAVRFLGTTHDFMMLNPLSDTPATRGAIATVIGYLQKAFIR